MGYTLLGVPGLLLLNTLLYLGHAQDKPQPVLTVSPSWLSPGDSVTLNCSVKDQTEGWRFFWYKALPKQSEKSYYRFELLPGSAKGTKQGSYIIHGQTHTAGYVCRAGRGDPVFYTLYSQPKFVWSGDFHSAASLKVSPDRVQHFTGESLTLICDANSTEWRVRKFSNSGYLTHCFSWGVVGRNTCIINESKNIDGVYWCESETGHFSNAVNITEYSGDIILVSPTRPVTEGDSVTLGCKFRKENVFSDVEFYKNDKLIQADTRGEMTISPVSKSDEGFYTCTRKDSQVWRSWTSQDSWMSVKSSEPKQNSLFSILMIVGLLCGVLLFILLLLFQYRHRESKGSCFKRSQSANQVPATDQAETEGRQYVTLLHGNVCLYETIRGSEEAEHGRNNEPEENEYINMTTKSATER